MTGPLMSGARRRVAQRNDQARPRDIVVLWTDGVTESRDAAGEELEGLAFGHSLPKRGLAVTSHRNKSSAKFWPRAGPGDQLGQR